MIGMQELDLIVLYSEDTLGTLGVWSIRILRGKLRY
jgi:hypothetical protein